MVRVCRDETLRLLLSLLRGLMRVPVAPVVLGFVAVITPVVVADGDGIVRVLAAIVSAPVLFVDLNGTACCFVGFVGSASVGSVGKPLASCWMSPMAEKSTSDSLNRPVTPSQKPMHTPLPSRSRTTICSPAMNIRSCSVFAETSHSAIPRGCGPGIIVGVVRI